MSIEAKFSIRRGDFTLDVALELPARGVTAVFGPSGCGKTTLLRAIAGLDRHQDGYLRIGDKVWQEDNHFVPPHRRALGYVFQEPSLFPHLTVQRNLEYGLKRVPQATPKVSLAQAIDLLAIGPLLGRKPERLSGGEQQRVAIARALAASPRLLLMDEPLASLDLQRKQEILPYIEALHNQLDIPVLYVSHAPEEVARLANHLVLLEDGGVKASGPIAAILTRLDLSLAHGSDAAALIEATVAGHDQRYHLTHLDSAAGRFTVIRQNLPVGNAVRLQVAARDVSLTLVAQSDTSIQNIFPATIDQLMPAGKAQMTVRLLVGKVPVLTRITRKSAVELGLQPGKSVYAQVKSVALLT